MLNLKGTCAYAAQLCSKSMTMKSGGSIARHALVALCSAGLKQHQECKKSLLHHQAVQSIPGLEHQVSPKGQVIGNVTRSNDHGWKTHQNVQDSAGWIGQQ